MKFAILTTIALCLASSQIRAGIIFDDPVEIQAKTVSHWFSKDEIHLNLAGKFKEFWFSDLELTVDLKYSDKSKTLKVSRSDWGVAEQWVIQIPDGLANLQSFTITGKYRSALQATGYTPNYNGEKEHDQKEIEKCWKPVTGYKIDSRFVMN